MRFGIGFRFGSVSGPASASVSAAAYPFGRQLLQNPNSFSE